MRRDKMKKEFHDVPGCDTFFSAQELQILYRFFDCRSKEELVRAAQRYDSILGYLSDIGESASLVRNLAVASEEFVDFASLGKKLQIRHPEKYSGPIAKNRNFPIDILDVIKKEQQRVDWHKKPTKLDVIKRLQNRGILTNELEASVLAKDIQAFARRRNTVLKAFDDIDFKKYTEQATNLP